MASQAPAYDTKTLLNRLASGATLSSTECYSALEALSSGTATPAQMAAFLMALRVRGETVEEITGAARLLRARMVPVDAPDDAIDIVGTGGDGLKTYNVSTCAAIVAASCGVPVAKHGNRSVSSLSGASDVLTALGVKIDLPPEAITCIIREVGVGFLWAPMHHPAMKTWAPVRADLGLRTLFNLLGPLVNPARVRRQVVGVFDAQWVEPIARVLGELGSVHAWVVHGRDGLDELSTTGPTLVCAWNAGNLRSFEVTPEEAGLERVHIDELRGGDAALNAQALRAVLAGEPGAYRDIVLFNTAAALIVAGKVSNLRDGADLARQSIDSGRAAQTLKALIDASRSLASSG
jgi:anthranilate phosphoribosyltransferase